jgi:hypothetical protein
VLPRQHDVRDNELDAGDLHAGFRNLVRFGRPVAVAVAVAA